MLAQPLVVSFADWNYQPLLKNWLYQLRQLGVHNIRIYALDAQTKNWCHEQGVASELLAWQGVLKGLWVRRIKVFQQLLEDGIEFVHSDIDAIWLKNPFEFGSAYSRTENLVFSQGTIWPADTHRDWGFVLCCGWFWVKPSAETRVFFDLLRRDVVITGDDQISVNRLLKVAGVRWASRAPDYRLDFKQDKVSCWREPLVGAAMDGRLSIAVLPHAEFQRQPEEGPGVVVRHFISPKNCAEKLALLSQWGLNAFDKEML